MQNLTITSDQLFFVETRHVNQSVARNNMKILIIAFVLFPAIFLWAEDETVYLKDGRYFIGRVCQLDEKNVVLEIEERTINIPISEIMPVSLYYLISQRTSIADIPAHLTLTQYCIENELYLLANKELELVFAADPSLKLKFGELSQKIHELGAKQLYVEAMKYLQKKNFDQAREKFLLIIKEFPGTMFTKLAIENINKISGQNSQE